MKLLSADGTGPPARASPDVNANLPSQQVDQRKKGGLLGYIMLVIRFLTPAAPQ